MEESASVRLRYSLHVLIAGLFGFIFWVGILVCWVGILVWIIVWPNKSVTTGVILGFTGFAMLSLFLIFFALTGWCIISDEDIVYSNMLLPPRRIFWCDIIKVDYSRGAGWFVLRKAQGKPAHISVMLADIEVFTKLALKKIPRLAFSELAFEMIQLSLASAKLRSMD